jgi:hypothetical protein
MDNLGAALCAPCIPFLSIYPTPRGGQSQLHGGVVHVASDMTTTARALLPRAANDPNHTVIVELKRKLAWVKERYMTGSLQPAKLRQWMQYLATTPLYQDEQDRIPADILSDAPPPPPPTDATEPGAGEEPDESVQRPTHTHTRRRVTLPLKPALDCSSSEMSGSDEWSEDEQCDPNDHVHAHLPNDVLVEEELPVETVATLAMSAHRNCSNASGSAWSISSEAPTTTTERCT